MKTWFITGTSRGFGREWAIAALDRGDKVAATARSTASLDDLVSKYGDAILPIKLDVTDRSAAFAAVEQAHKHFGRLDVIVNNAGYGHFGMIEEITEDELRAQLETNVLGAFWVTQASLPWHLRHHALFVCFGPVDNPRYACSVIVEHGQAGGGTAGPIGRDVLLATMKRDPSRRTDGFKKMASR